MFCTCFSSRFRRNSASIFSLRSRAWTFSTRAARGMAKKPVPTPTSAQISPGSGTNLLSSAFGGARNRRKRPSRCPAFSTSYLWPAMTALFVQDYAEIKGLCRSPVSGLPDQLRSLRSIAHLIAGGGQLVPGRVRRGVVAILTGLFPLGYKVEEFLLEAGFRVFRPGYLHSRYIEQALSLIHI